VLTENDRSTKALGAIRRYADDRGVRIAILEGRFGWFPVVPMDSDRRPAPDCSTADVLAFADALAPR
jgi:hypothetical protein